MSGLTTTGFQVRRLRDILDAIDADLRSNLSDQLDLDDEESIIGQVRGAFANEVALVWEALADLYRALDPDSAVGEQLDVIGRFNGLTRLAAARGTGTITASGTAGTVIPDGSRASNSTTNVVVETVGDATIGGGGSVTIPVRTVEAGAAVSGSNGIDTIVTPVAGWASISASSEIVGARDRESDTDYRLRLINVREIVASVEGAIRAKLLEVESVTSAIVLSNRSSSADSNATPAHTVRAVIQPDLTGQTDVEDAIAAALFETLPAGIPSVGIGASARTGTVLDQQGYQQSVGWEYPTAVDISVDIEVTIDFSQTTLSSADVESLIDETIADYIDGLGLGTNVRTSGIECAVDDAIPGALWAVDSLLLDIVAPPSGTASIGINFNEFARAGTLTVTVNAL